MAALTADSRLTRLVEAAAAVAGQAGLGEVLITTVQTAQELTGARYGALGVLGDHGLVIEFHHRGVPPETADAIGRLPEGRGVLGTITREAKTVRVDDVSVHPDSIGFPEHHPKMTEFLGVPVRVGESVYGNLYLADKEGGFTEEDEAMVESLAVVAASAVSTARLRQRLQAAAVVEERERIARDLHDSVIQDLFAVGLSLQASAGEVTVDPDGVGERLMEAVDRLDSSIATLRRYIFGVARSTENATILEGRLRHLLDDLARPYGTDVLLSVSTEIGDISDEVADDVMQFVSEAVTNALRHSGAGSVEVTLLAGDEHLTIEVGDDGQGFDPEAVTKGMGLENLMRRARGAGGQFELISSPGAGTTVRAAFPLGSV